jgi:hypothetical protein
MNFSIVVTTGNAAQWIGKCIASIAIQNTRWNWKCLVIDDASTDGTCEEIESAIQGIDPSIRHRFLVQRNASRLGGLANLVNGFEQLGTSQRSMDVLIPIDGDDWLFSSSALETIATAYEQHDCWLTYGGFITSPGGDLFVRAVEEDVIRTASHRRAPWVTSHLRSFRSHLWHAIHDKDLRNEHGTYYDVTWDMAMMFPMLEMAGERIHCVTKAVYVYNTGNIESNHIKRRSEQISAEQSLRSAPPYQRLAQAIPCAQSCDSIDCLGFIVLCEDDARPMTRLVQSLNGFYESPPIQLVHPQNLSIPSSLSSDVRLSLSPASEDYKRGEFSQVDALLKGLQKATQQWSTTEWFAVLDCECHPLIDVYALLKTLRSSDVDGYLHAESIVPGQLSSPWQVTCWQRFGGHEGHHPFNDQLICYAGSPWMLLRRSAIDALLDFHHQQAWLAEYYRKQSKRIDVPAPEESYVHTVLCNQPHLRFHHSPICWADWSGGWPRILQAQDWHQITSSGYWFAQRFRDPESSALIDRLHGLWMSSAGYSLANSQPLAALPG